MTSHTIYSHSTVLSQDDKMTGGCCKGTCSRLFIEDVQRRGIVAARGVASSLTPGLITRLVGVPELPTVVAELCVASLTAAAQLRALCTAVSDHCIAED